MGQPVEPIIQAGALGGTGGLDVPLWGEGKKTSVAGKKGGPPSPLWLPWERQDPHRAAAQVLQPQLVSQLAHGHGVGHVLLVGKHQQHRIPQLVLLQLREVKAMEAGVPAESLGLPFPAV